MQCEPIIEEPATPEPECLDTLESAIEDAFWTEDHDEIPMIKLSIKEFLQNVQNYMQEKGEFQDVDMLGALVALTQEAATIPMPKLKNVSRLRTEQQVWTEENLTIHLHIFLLYGHQVKLHNPFNHVKLIAPPKSLVIYAARRHALHAIAWETQRHGQSRGTLLRKFDSLGLGLDL
ncbi:hypothetical protein MRB53_011002 [Persea americana]|uniref:Uncharacterized protein n=1 Tax=Persea americana TaxID=3435 RepID=A0ACC2LTK1_PERAE|nr:hypothetical protein MRB53_011002 [Persea americana]